MWPSTLRLPLSSTALVTCLGEAVPLDVATAVAVVADYRVLWVAVIPVATTFTCGVADVGAQLAGDVRGGGCGDDWW